MLSRALLFCFILLVPAAATAQDNNDRGFIQGLLEDALSAPGRSVTMHGFAGALSSRATIEKITVTDPQGVWITIHDVALIWSRAALLSGAIEIDEISVGRIDLPRLPELPPSEPTRTASTQPFSLPTLPVSVNVATMHIDEAQLGAALFGQAARVSFSGSAQMADGAGDVTLNMQRLDQDGQLQLTGGFNNDTRVLDLDFDLNEPKDGIAANLLSLPGKPSVRLTAKGQDPIDDFEAQVRLRTAGKERLSGQVTLLTEQDGTNRFAATLGGDIAPVFVPEFAEFLGDDVQMITQGHRAPSGALVLDQLTLSAAALSLHGSAEISPDGWPQKLALDGAITPPSGERVVLPLPGARISLASAVLTGGFDAGAGDEWHLRGEVSGLNQQGVVALSTVTFDGAGNITRAQNHIDGALTLAADGIAPSAADLARAVGDTLRGALRFDWSPGAPLTLSDLDISGHDYGVQGTISLAQTPTNTSSAASDFGGLVVTPEITLAAQDLSRFSALSGLDLAGAAKLDIFGEIAPLTGALGLQFSGETTDLATGIAQLDPLISGPGTLALTLIRDQTGLRSAPLIIETDHANLTLSAQLTETTSTADLHAVLHDLSRVIPDLPGAVTLTAKAKQSEAGWHIDLRSALPGASQIAVNGLLSESTPQSWHATGTATAEIGRLASFSRFIGRPLAGQAQLSATGTADLQDLSFDLIADGQLVNPQLGMPEIEALLRGTSRFDLAATRSGDVTVLKALNVTATGISADISGKMTAETGEAAYQVTMPDLGLIVPELPGAVRLSGTATKQGPDWYIDAKGQGPGGISLASTGRVAQTGAQVDLSLVGAAPLAIANQYMTGQAVSGQALFDLRLRGAPALNSLSGPITLSGARYSMPDFSLSLENISGGATLAGGRATLDISGDVATGGRVRATGPIGLEPPFNADLGVTLSSVTLRDASLYEANLAGQVYVKGALTGGAIIGGEIALSSAELRIPQLSPSYSALDGLRHLNPSIAVKRTLRFSGLETTKQPKQAPSVAYPLDLTISAPNKLFIRGRGLDAEMAGSLRLTGTSNDVVPIGGFDLVRGRLELLSRRLELSEGTVQLRGSFDPVIDFAATSEVEDVEVSLRLRGLASEPELTVTSTPDMPQDEALSYFLFGRDATSISPLQAVQLASALRTLSGRGGLGIAEQLRQGLGFDDLDIGTDEDGKAQAKVGKYISDNIYTDVTVKSGGDSQINLNFDVSPSVTVRGRVNNDGESGVGVYFERDY